MDLIEMLLKKIKLFPDREAIVSSASTLTYKQLDELTSKVSNYLRIQGVGKDDVVTIETSDRLEAICMIVGVIKAGAAYCMIPVDYPEYRKEKMRKRVNAKFKLTDLSDIENVALHLSSETITRNENSLLYIIFTSGSTGEPKAVAVEDRAILKIVNHTDFYKGNVIGQLAPLEFDASIYEVFGGLLNGLTLRLINKDESLDLDAIPKIFEEIDMIFLTTRLFNLYVDECLEQFSKLSLVLTGGERCSVRHLIAAANHCKILHVYGPTETTVFATKYEVEGTEGIIPIGKIFDEGKHVIIDENHQEVRSGEEGELCIADSGLMRGYIGDAKSNQKVFLNHEGKYFYRTGDIVYENNDKNIVYVERKDRQVKISGYRIELSEIEKCANEFGLKKDCFANYDGKRLNLFVQDKVNLDEFRNFLRSRLPEYMIPTVKVVDNIPMNMNGKTDVKAITEASLIEKKANNEFIEVVEKILKSEVEPEKTFLDLGGDSIKAMEIIWELGSKGYNLDLNMLFNQTMGEIMENVTQS